MLTLHAPDVRLPVEQGRGFAPSWSGWTGHLGDEHRGIHAATRDLPGWQDPPDSEKLYEVAYHCGAVILEIGVYGGRSAVVELRGALAAARDRGGAAPQYYGVDIDPAFFDRAARTLTDAGLAEHCLLYHGDLRRFLAEVPIVPTMVFVDGDHSRAGVWADLERLRSLLVPGTPVLCHDYWGIDGVRSAVDDWIASGAYEAAGSFAGSILLCAKTTRGRSPRGLSPETFAQVRTDLWTRYASSTPPMLRRDRHHTPVRDLTAPARRELLGPGAGRVLSGRGAWPWACDDPAVPATMPGGRPWPRITVVTPTLNQGRFIEQTILSVLNQGYPNLEFIVLDGGSTDETLAVVERYRDRLDRVISGKDEGQSDAINRGMAQATGDILTWLNSDDMLAPGALPAIALAFSSSGADLVAGELRVVRDGRLVTRHVPVCDDGVLPLDQLLDIDGRWLAGQFFYQPEVFFTRSIWDRAGGRVDPGLYHSMDYDLWVRMAGAGAKLHVIGRPIAIFRAHPDQKTAGDIVGGYRAELPRARDAAAARLGRPVPPASPPLTRPRLRIAMFNDVGYAYGAGIAHRRIAHALALAGHDVHAIAAARVEPTREPAGITGASLLDALDEIKPDLVVVGNLHGADLDPALLGAVAERYETVFVMHDLWLLTGRCAYPGGCRRYLDQCHAGCTCPGDHPALRPDLIRPAWQSKRGILAACPKLRVWAASPWTHARALEALGHAANLTTRVEPLGLGVETDVFTPRDRMTCREILGLPRDRFIIMSSASSLADPRKGLAHLAQALESLARDDILVVCAGWFRDGDGTPIPEMRAMGYMRDPRQLAMLYAAADLFVGPSLEEAFGQVFIEAAACGTPSVGYPVGGVPDAILDGVSGRVAASVSPAALADAIDELYGDSALRVSMGRWGRVWAENEWSIEALSRRIACLLRRSGVADRLGLVPRLNFRLLPTSPPEPRCLPCVSPGWRAVRGFEPWAGPFPARRLPRCRWAHGPISTFEIDSTEAGPARVIIECRSLHPGQRVRLVRNGMTIGEHPAPRGDHVLAFPVELARGPNRFDMHLWHWRQTGTPLGMIVVSITAIPIGDPAVAQTSAHGASAARAAHP